MRIPAPRRRPAVGVPMQSTETVAEPTIVSEHDVRAEEWIVIVFDNDANTFAEVIDILIEATGCTMEEASLETWEVHHLGRSVVHHGDQPECERVAAIIRRIGIEVGVRSL